MTSFRVRSRCFAALLLALGLACGFASLLQAQGRKINTNIYTPPSVRERYPNQGLPRAQVPIPPQAGMPQLNIPASMKIRYEDDRITLDIRNTPIQQALEEFALRTGVVFEVSSLDNDPIFISLFRVSLQDAVQRLVGPGNAITYSGKDDSGRDRVLFVRALNRKNPSLPTSLRYLGTGTIAKAGEDVVDTPDQALKALAASNDVDLRQKAVEILAGTKSDFAVSALTIALDDPAPEVRVAAIENLAKMGSQATLPRIIILLKDQHPGVRRSAIVAIALMGDVSSMKALRPMGQDPDPSVVAEAEAAIKKLSTRRP